MSAPRIIVHADDFGLHPCINAAVVQGHQNGILSSASLLVDGDAADEAARIAHLLPGLDIGLHFTLTGMEGGLSRFAWDWMHGRFKTAVIETALRRQLQTALDRYGLPLTHIDSHQHLHALPSVCRIVCRVAKEYSITCVRIPEDGFPYALVPPARRAQAAALRVVARLSRRIVHRAGLKTTDRFSGMAMSGHLSAPTLAQYIQGAGPGTTEIVCHPGTDTRALSAPFRWGYDWEGELHALCAPEMQSALRVANASLIGWRDL